MKRVFLSLLITLLALFILIPNEGQAIQQQCGDTFEITGTATVTARDPVAASMGAQKAAKSDYEQKVEAYQCPAECPVLTKVGITYSGGTCVTPNNIPPTTCQGWMKSTFKCQP